MGQQESNFEIEDLHIIGPGVDEGDI